MTDDLLDELLSGGGKTFFTKDDPVGRSVTGTVTSVRVRQVTSFETGKPEFWDDGQPKRQVVITLATAERDPADGDDDGHRNIYVKGWGEQRQALAKAGKPAVGDTLTVTFSGLGDVPGKGMNAPKRYDFRLVKGSPLDALDTPTPAAAPDVSKVPALRQAGLSDDQIAAATGLSLAQVQAA